MLSDLQQNAFKILNALTFYLPPFPLKWNASYSKLQKRKPIYKSIPYIFSASYTIFIAFVFMYLLLQHGFLNVKPKLGESNIAIYIMTVAVTLAFGFIASVIFLNFNQYLSGFHQLFQIILDLNIGK